ncbi:S66 peptidase family protein [Rubrivirga litoralis]|uniref:LD-carboxypeptidase n=1 Tax=Rubrivirga litoralis TaxID=3075598 RepID=A0ABU3BN07_9BACT|nr:LD-carboxypeptidase [Rubrivirga sp. F394]MDT0630663.1 LD-carboxypeptidase [Rubrivirga sp. F394]
MPRPAPLLPSGRVAVAAPSSAALDPADAEAGLAALRTRGLAVEAATVAGGAVGYLAGADGARADALNTLLRRDDLDAVVCLRGGYGLLRILDRIDYNAARAHRPLVVGYSDVTALHLALYARAGLAGVSGPMVAPDWPDLDAETEAAFWRVVGGAAGYDLAGPGAERLAPLQDGEAEGVLLGGNLALTAALVGTPYLPALDGAILFLEDVGEPPYRIDGLLARLRLAGVLGRLGGLVFGQFTGAAPPADRPSLSVDEVLAHYSTFVDGPVATGLVYGHVPRKVTVPIGVRAHLAVEGGAAALTVLDPVTA